MWVLSALNDLLLKMTWLSEGLKLILSEVFQLDVRSGMGASIHFFVYDSVKIFILLSVLIYGVSYIQSYFPPEKVKIMLGGIKGIKGNLLGALMGTVTPFCSCSSIPIFMGFTAARLPLGITISFLISSPLVDLASIMILISFFGFKIAMAYVVAGLLIAVLSGYVIEKMGMADQVADFVKDLPNVAYVPEVMSHKQRHTYAKDQVVFIVKKVWQFILLGVAIGAFIHNWVPESFVSASVGQNNPLAVLIVTAIGIPMYADIFGTLPIAEALYYKQVGIGTILAFMMSVTALSLPSMMMLSQVIKKKLLFVFIALVSISIVAMGYTFNALQTWLM